ncbi:MAG: hypothetical protein KAJ40_01370 [Alphaproteobacteria bacterium]|nr:hypothetical protein [Alphaproteobacteria bacterium]
MSFDEAKKANPNVKPEDVTAAYDRYPEAGLPHMHVMGKDIDEGGHVLGFKGFKGKVGIMPFNREAMWITYQRPDGSKGLRPAFSEAEQGDVVEAAEKHRLPEFTESRTDENAPIIEDPSLS